MEDRTVSKPTNPFAIAGHMTWLYDKLFNKDRKSYLKELHKIIGLDLNKIGKISEEIREKLCWDIT